MSVMAAAATRPIMGLVMYSRTPLAEAAGEKIREYPVEYNANHSCHLHAYRRQHLCPSLL